MSWVIVALLGGIVGLDATSVAQIMISRPLVVGTLAGFLLGVPVQGALLGALFEIFHLSILPIGAARYPEAGTATVAATAALSAAPAATHGSAGLLLALVFALGWERVAGMSVSLFRRNVERVLFAPERRPAHRELVRRHVIALSLDALRGVIVCLVGAGAGTLLLRAAAPFWGVEAVVTLGALAIASTIVLAGALTIFGGWTTQYRVFLLGALCGTLLLVLR
jgi:mannose/fructose/N-acetylgalactosamine-specific phosphotransferase system component IIC